MPKFRIAIILNSVLLLGIVDAGYCDQASSQPSPQPPPLTEPSTQTASDPDNQHLNSLMDELVNVEGLIDGINKKLKVNTYKAGVAADRKEGAENGKVHMDLQGGGPVSWREFYGQTARDFSSRSETTVDVNRSANGAHLSIQSGSYQPTRPRIFNYVYNGQNRLEANAQHDMETLEKRNEDLVARRRQLELDQSSLWAQVTFEVICDREITLRALYRNVVTFDTAESSAVKDAKLRVFYAATEFLRTVELSVKHVDLDVRTNQERSFAILRDLMKGADGRLAESVANFEQSQDVTPDDVKLMKEIAASARQISLSTQDVCDAFQHAKEGDSANDDNQIQFQRGKLQRSLLSFSATFGQLDDKVVALAHAWNVEVRKGAKHAYQPIDFKAADKAETSNTAPTTPAPGGPKKRKK